MVATGSETIAREILGAAGIRIDGEAPWDIRVHDARFYGRVLEGSLGLGESYVDGWWDCPSVDELISRICAAELDKKTRLTPDLLVAATKARVLNMQRSSRAYDNVAHYDVGNDLFEAMLGPSMAYSCAYWPGAAGLDEAQRQKFDLICRKLDLKSGERLLDIGCGFGTLAKHAATHYGVSVVGLTIAKEQQAYAAKLNAGLPVEILLCDYRDPKLLGAGPFDKAVSVGMIEHVGVKNYRRYMEIVASALKDHGLFLLQCIGTCVSRKHGDRWLSKYFYPNGMLPSPADLSRAAERLLILEDWHSFGSDYDKTLMAWHENFERYAKSEAFQKGERFHRMWRYYLLMLAGAFRSRNKNQLWQVVFAKNGIPGGYVSIR